MVTGVPHSQPTTQAPVSARHDLLRFLTCGSVDDGKSTLIGRLLYDSKLILDDQLATLARDSAKHGTTGDDLDFALLVDGLEAEREQGITIDVAYRFFSTPRRSFIVADTPGHEQYTRNMATGASGSDVAVILIDARKGVLTQTRRHTYICSLLGIRHICVAVNKIDLVAYSGERFHHIVGDYLGFAQSLGFGSITAIPISARLGDNVTQRSQRLGWYEGPTLLEYLESVEIDSALDSKPFRMPVQWVNRANQDFRGFCGTVVSGVIRPNDRIVVAQSGRETTVKRIVTADGDLPAAYPGDAITLTLADEVDIARGDVLARSDSRPEVVDQFAAHILWMAEEPMFPGRSYLLRIGTKYVPARVTTLKHKVDVNNLEHMQSCLDAVLPYVHERRQFGQPIGTFQLMQAKVADLYTTLNASRAYVYAVARACDRGQTTRFDAAGCILFAAERATACALDTIQALGGNGYINDYPAGRLLRDAKLYEIGAGTSEIRRMLIGRELFDATA